MKCDFDILEPEDRRTILVASDEKYSEMVSKIKFRQLLLASLWPVVLALGIIPGPGTILAITSIALRSMLASGLSMLSGQQALIAILKAKEIPVPHLPPKEAAKRFKFDQGHPQDGFGYLLDPIVDDHYLLPALANERLAQDKVAAFYELVSALGAKKLELSSGELNKHGGSAGANIPLKEVAAEIGINATFDTDGEVKRSICAEFDRPTSPPAVPDSIEPWLVSDPIMRSMAKTRLSGTVLKLTVSLVVDSIMAINAKALAGFAKFKIDVGGSYRHVRKSTWVYEVEFWPKK